MKYIMLLLMIAQALFVNSPAWSNDNPFEEGTKTPVLTDDERTDLLKYAETSKSKLVEALKQAEGQTIGLAMGIYTSTILQVVQESYRDKKRSELLMRIALNQGLEMAIGVPKVDNGQIVGWQRAGTRMVMKNWESNEMVLRESIELAIKYYEDDRKAIESKSLINLPYVLFAAHRVSLAQKWLDTITESKLFYNNQLVTLRHWLTLMLNEEQISRAKYAAEILLADKTLNEMKEYPKETKEMQRRVAVLRGVLTQIVPSELTFVVKEKNIQSSTERARAKNGYYDASSDYASYSYDDFYKKAYYNNKSHVESIGVADACTGGLADFGAYRSAYGKNSSSSESLNLAKLVVSREADLDAYLFAYYYNNSNNNSLAVAKAVAEKKITIGDYGAAYCRNNSHALAFEVALAVVSEGIDISVYTSSYALNNSHASSMETARKTAHQKKENQ